MTQEEKAKAYDEALKQIKECIPDENGFITIYPDEIFPELYESEDERIRKELITHCRNTRCVTEEGAEGIAKWIAWLEKQGEQKSINDTDEDIVEAVKGISILDLVEPKFKVGDWVVWDNKISCHIDNIYQGKESLMYTITDIYNMTRSYSVKGFDNNAHLWTIQDAKDGDVLVADEMIVLLKKKLENDSILTYSHYDIIDDEYEPGCHLYYAHIYPATKEQRDLLFQKMKEAGYEWNEKEKRLIEVPKTKEETGVLKQLIDESKSEIDYCFTKMMNGEKVSPTWSEEDEDAIEMAIIALEDMYDEDAPNTTYGGYNLPFNKAAERLKSLKERVGCEMNCTTTKEWSEEDESYLNTTIAYLKDAKDFKKTAKNCIDWLISIKDRVQPKQEWSEEGKQNLKIEGYENLSDYEKIFDDIADKYIHNKNQKGYNQSWYVKERAAEMLYQSNKELKKKVSWSEEDGDIRDNIIRDLKRLSGDMVSPNQTYQKEIQWLKSLRPQNRWKPSDEQMRALHNLNLIGNISYAGQGQTLIQLYNDLKKLKGE